MLTKSGGHIPASEITPRALVIRRRDFLGAIVAAAGLPGGTAFGQTRAPSDAPTPKSTVTSYGNYYEFSSDKPTAYRLAKALTTSPWTVSVEGLCAKPGTFSLDDLIKPSAVEERVYRMRCVEGWSMVIPWNGFPLASLITRAGPLASATFVEFTSVQRPQEMPGQRGRVLSWPYREGLRLDEATHPLTILATGLYGEPLLNQNGAPLRLVVPWKYGFKSIKAIVKIRFTDRQPMSAWQNANADYYGFYANVNPNVPTPSYSQAKERRLGEFFMRPTLMFNGYADQVASLYSGMNLRTNF